MYPSVFAQSLDCQSRPHRVVDFRLWRRPDPRIRLVPKGYRDFLAVVRPMHSLRKPIPGMRGSYVAHLVAPIIDTLQLVYRLVVSRQ